MRNVLATVVVLSCFATISAIAQPGPSPFESVGLKAIVARTNEFQTVLSKTYPTEDEYLALAKGACGDLKILLTDRNFLDSLYILDKASQSTIEARRTTLNVLHDFALQFNRFERDALANAGLSPNSVDFLIKSAESLHIAVTDENKSASILDAIKWVTNNLCDAERSLRNEVNHQVRMDKLKKYAIGFTGVVFIGVDGAAAVVTIVNGGAGVAALPVYVASANIGMRLIGYKK